MAAARKRNTRGRSFVEAPAACFLVWLLAAATMGCGDTQDEIRDAREPRKPDVLVVTIDTARADRFSHLGDSPVETSASDALAADGAAFLQAITPAPITLPAHASLFTGRNPLNHGVRSNGVYRLPDSERTLAEILKAAGYRTAAFLGSVVLAERHGLAQGFDLYDDEMDATARGSELGMVQRTGDHVVEAALRWLGQQSAAPTFAWVHLFDPHAPYTPPEPEKSRYSESPYDAEIAYADRMVQKLLDGYRKLGRYRDAIVVLTSDHGESLGEHGERTHGIFIYDATVRIPLVIRGPGIAPGTRVAKQVSLIDVLPTLLDLLALPPATRADGESLLPLLVGAGEERGERFLYLESLYPRIHHGWHELKGLRSPQWKLISGAALELYALGADPREVRDLAEPEQERVLAMRGLLEEAFPERDDDGRTSISLPDAERERLEALGYTWTNRANARAPKESGGDPRHMIHAMARMDLTRTLLGRGDLTGAIGIAEEVVASDPSNPHFLEQLGDYYVYANRSRDALEAFDRAIALQPQDADAWSKRGYALQQLDREMEAIAAYEKALAADPRHRSSRHNRWGLLLMLGRASQVAEEAAVALQHDGADAEARWASIRARLAAGTAQDLIPELEIAVRESPRDGSLKMELAMLLELRGDQKRAETLYREVMASDPAHSLAPIRLARLLIGAGRHSEAKRLLEGADRLRRDATFLRLLAEARLGAGDATGAAEALHEALRLAPGRAEIWSALGTLQLQHGDSQGALRSLREAVALDPRDASAWRAMAEAHERLGQSGPASQARERARQAAGG